MSFKNALKTGLVTLGVATFFATVAGACTQSENGTPSAPAPVTPDNTPAPVGLIITTKSPSADDQSEGPTRAAAAQLKTPAAPAPAAGGGGK